MNLIKPESEQHGTSDTETHGRRSSNLFVEERITCEINMQEKIPKSGFKARRLGSKTEKNVTSGVAVFLGLLSLPIIKT